MIKADIINNVAKIADITQVRGRRRRRGDPSRR